MAPKEKLILVGLPCQKDKLPLSFLLTPPFLTGQWRQLGQEDSPLGGGDKYREITYPLQHRQNRLNLGKVNLIYLQLKYFLGGEKQKTFKQLIFSSFSQVWVQENTCSTVVFQGATGVSLLWQWEPPSPLLLC